MNSSKVKISFHLENWGLEKLYLGQLGPNDLSPEPDAPIFTNKA